ncbi:glucan endo-1,3-beta-glucosidase 12-like isoform X2 [Amborella trichopoda]|uniref:glucan endo-1,3-beta-glucosidase 12-like isoform X2 n=1 Tax=Amborella trichopoda TaxID=13333 RepID=UPI0009BD3B43|nr:glucan endo-1,3-beta-glucosidase 12-like isoform X2 [Amborella trichopoda]|eukprot:XP_020525839.1 glucan endo-1,3-beta-glucosidase 12-like isoform X2 [Amborella trichopoda]
MVSLSSTFSLLLFLLTVLLSLNLPFSDGEDVKEWCIADSQFPNEQLQAAMDWACGPGGADCTKIQPGGECYKPNTVLDHASFAFNSYWQKFKNQGASCYFNAAAFISEEDPMMDRKPQLLAKESFPLFPFPGNFRIAL